MLLILGNIKFSLQKLFEDVLLDYGTLIAFLTIGIIIGWYIKFLISDRKYNKQIKIRFSEKDQKIAELQLLISERLAKVKVEEKDKTFFAL